MVDKPTRGHPHPHTFMPLIEAVGIMRATAITLANDFKRLCGVVPSVTDADRRRHRLDPREQDDLDFWISVGRGF